MFDTTRPVAHTTCRACAAPLDPVLDLGHLHLSAFPACEEALPQYPRIPLTLAVCSACVLVQLTHTTPWAWMYGQAHYWYRSAINETMRAELGDVAQTLRSFSAHPGELIVLDVGANDGTLLASYGPDPYKIAVEPSTSLHAELRSHCHELHAVAFPSPQLESWAGRVDCLSAVAMLYDLEDPTTFFPAVAQLLSPTGVCAVQFQDLLQMLEQTAFDTITMEHLEYYSLWSLLPLIFAADLSIIDVEPRAINGGSLRILVGHPGVHARSARVTAWLEREQAAGLTEASRTAYALQALGRQIHTMRTQTLAMLHAIHANGGIIDLWGASTKANTLLQVYGIDAGVIRQAVERSPEKVGRYVGQTGIPIVSEAEGRADPAAIALVGPWQFRDSILARETGYLAQGGQFLFPLPRVEIVSGAQRPSVWGVGEGVA